MNPFFKAMQPKKKRPVDPNAPPRPNLLNHEKRIKEASTTVEQLQSENAELKHRMAELERKMINQTAYLNSLHQYVHSKIKG